MTKRDEQRLARGGFRTWFWPNRYDAQVEQQLAIDAECLLLTSGSVTAAQKAMLLERALERAFRQFAALGVAAPLALGLVFALWSSLAGWIAAGVVFGTCALRTGITGLELLKARRLRTAASAASERLAHERRRFLN